MMNACKHFSLSGLALKIFVVNNVLFLFQHSLNYQQYFLQSMLQYICDKQPELRQASAYGVGVMAQFGGDGYAQACSGG